MEDSHLSQTLRQGSPATARLRRIDRQHDNKSVNLDKDMADNPLFPGGDVYGDESIQSSGSADAGSGARRNRLLFSVSTV